MTRGRLISFITTNCLSRIKYLFPTKYVTNINSIKKRETHQFHSVNYKRVKKYIPQMA